MKIKTKIILVSSCIFFLLVAIMIVAAFKTMEMAYTTVFSSRSDIFFDRFSSLIDTTQSRADIDFLKLKQKEYTLTDFIVYRDGNEIFSTVDNEKILWYHGKRRLEKNRIYGGKKKHLYYNSFNYNNYRVDIFDYSDFFFREKEVRNKGFFKLIPIFFIISFAVIVLVVFMAFKPISKMIEKLNSISAKNLDQRIPLPKAKDELHNLGSAMNRMIEKLEKAFESQKQFIANASHELKTPLTIMSMELQLLAKNLQTDEDRESAQNILEEIDRLNGLCNDLLTTAKLESGQYEMRIEELLLEDIIVDTTKKFSSKLVNPIDIQIENSIQIKGDYKLLYQVFFNILDNSRKYGGKEVKIKISLRRDQSRSKIVIEDNGAGIKKDDIEKIYNRFFRSNEIMAKTEGSGLGLAIVKEIVELHDGKIEVMSEFGNYTRVTIEFLR